jgi:2-polyprenyl-3-methyl-5-hydroxy-6-metoxy-1,4-benzoquinol methylase
MTTIDEKAEALETQAVEEFAQQIVGAIDACTLTFLLSIGSRAGLLDRLATLPPSTSARIAEAAGLQERYVREWLDGLTAAGVVEYDDTAGLYSLPREHAACLTTAAGPENLAHLAEMMPMLARVEDGIVAGFREGGGVGYDAFTRFHAWMAADSAAVHEAGLIDAVVPLIPRLRERLEAGIHLADIGCGSGHAVNLLAREFPRSRFSGFDFEADAIAAAEREVETWGLTNAAFHVQDVAEPGPPEQYDVITAFDAVHDQAHPAQVLANVHRALRPGGVFLMVDVNVSSNVADNVGVPMATFVYTTSLMHCMTVSLSQGGVGLGAAWGRQTATRMLAEAGFTGVEVYEPEHDPFNAYYVAHKA